VSGVSAGHAKIPEHLFDVVYLRHPPVTSQGHAYTRFRRSLEPPRSASIIRAAAAELPGPVPLEDALEVCLALLELEPPTFDHAAARWAARLVIERRLSITDAQLAISATAALGRGEQRAGAEALICLCERYKLDRGERILTTWLERRGLGI
jgi:hypothetical protein